MRKPTKTDLKVFGVESITGSTHDSSYGGYPWKITVVVKMDAKAWKRHADKGWLGQLYGIDISNYVYGFSRAIPAHAPTVDHGQRAKDGVKTIKLTYFLRDPKKAEALGFKVTYLKNGEFFGAFSEYIKIMEGA